MGVDFEIAEGKVPTDFKLSYGIPFGLMYCAFGGFTHRARWNHPTEVVMVADSAGLIMGFNLPEMPGLIPGIAWAEVCGGGCIPGLNLEEETRHHGGSNISFGDGHVKWYRSQNCKVREFGGTLRLVGWFNHPPCNTEL